MTPKTSRFTIDIPAELSFRIYETFPYGARRRVVTALLEQVVDLVEQHGESILGKIMDGDLTLQESALRDDLE